MAARKSPSAFRMSDAHRTKIANSQILKCLIEHAEGTREMSSTQVTAGIALLRKVMPDLSSVEAQVTGSVQVDRIERVLVPAKQDESVEHTTH